MVLLRLATAASRSATRCGALPRRLVHTEAKIAELGYTLPSMPAALGLYVPAARLGNVIHTAGHIPFGDPLDPSTLYVGKVGLDYTVEEGQNFARIIGLELLATLKHELGDLDRVKRIVKVVGFVNCPNDFTNQPEVLNGCSELFGAVFGERGAREAACSCHTQSAIFTPPWPHHSIHRHRGTRRRPSKAPSRCRVCAQASTRARRSAPTRCRATCRSRSSSSPRSSEAF